VGGWPVDVGRVKADHVGGTAVGPIGIVAVEAVEVVEAGLREHGEQAALTDTCLQELRLALHRRLNRPIGSSSRSTVLTPMCRGRPEPSRGPPR
jgi:hypothetical protein